MNKSIDFASQKDMKAMLENARVIAVVGYSDKPHRTSYQIAKYLSAAGYKVYPVNPAVDQIEGEKSYASVADIPETVDIVDVFRRSEFLDGIVEDAVAAGAKNIWGQLGVFDEQAGMKAVAAGMGVVMDHCIKIEHRRLIR